MAPPACIDVPAERWMSLLRFYVTDWILFVLLAILTGGLETLKPFQRYVGDYQLTSLMYPLRGDTVPNWAVPVLSYHMDPLVDGYLHSSDCSHIFGSYPLKLIGVILPLAVLFLFFCIRNDKRDFHQAVLGLLYTMVLVALITDTLKYSVGRPRPDFFARCFPNGIAAFADGGNVVCTGEGSVIREGFKSFPSGHCSWSFGGLAYIALYSSGKLKALGAKSQLWRVLAVGMPLVAAAAVAVSRLDDYMHFWTDILVGSILGIVVAWICYFYLYPPLTSLKCDVPRISQGAPPRMVGDRGDGE